MDKKGSEESKGNGLDRYRERTMNSERFYGGNSQRFYGIVF